MREVIKKSLPNSLVTRAQYEGILTEITDNMPLRVWGNHIGTIIENRWHQTTDIAIRKYYGAKLWTTPMSIFEEIEKESTIE